MKSFLTLSYCFVLALQSYAQYGYDTVKVYFPINVTALDYSSRQLLDSVAGISRQDKLLIYGYADYLGNEPSNMDLAIGRANQVKQYLLSRKVSPDQILICEGIGQVKRDLEKRQEGYPEDRRVAVFIKRNTPRVQAKSEPGQQTEQKVRVSEITRTGKLIPLQRPEKTRQKEAAIPSKSLSPLSSVRSTVSKPLKPETYTGLEKLSELNAGDVMRIETIHFQPTRHYLTTESEPVARELLQTMQKFPDLAIRIEGHVCCMKGDGDALDSDTRELKLSENRARYIYDYLIERGIAKERLEYAGFGKSRPIIPVEQTEDDAQKNRRVEIRVLRN